MFNWKRKVNDAGQDSSGEREKNDRGNISTVMPSVQWKPRSSNTSSEGVIASCNDTSCHKDR